jgi:hypothetical protein
MDRVVLGDIPFQPDLNVLMKRVRIGETSPYATDLAQFLYGARAMARPKAMYRVGYVESRGDDHVVIDGVTLRSRVLCVNLEHAHRVLLYVATCGTELVGWTDSLDDLLQKYWAEAVQHMALRAASAAMNAHMVECYHLGKTSTMAPGSLKDWPLREQRPLFTLLGDTEGTIGVRLSDSLLMLPTKSVSGIRFPTEENFKSCQLCPSPDCPGRRAAYDRELYDKKYRLGANPA